MVLRPVTVLAGSSVLADITAVVRSTRTSKITYASWADLIHGPRPGLTRKDVLKMIETKSRFPISDSVHRVGEKT